METKSGITRVELSEAVYRRAGLSRRESADLTESVLKEISDCIVRGETVKLPGFATFSVRKKGQRLGRNPKTGVAAIIERRRVAVFNASPIMKAQINATHVSRSQSAEIHSD